ncbi:N-6 DNA methylase [Microbacterium sp. NPDC019599]|uniref:N-6 DNA methylase n=1 Tax=Microbacterium sp. NPDC019599 TaxID=3154690 RepID=UPI00340763EB
MNPDDLVSLSDIAIIAGVKISTASNWKKRFRDSFPPELPDPEGGKRARYERAAIEAWLAANPQLATVQQLGDAESRVYDALRGQLRVDQYADVIGGLLIVLRSAPAVASTLDRAEWIEVRNSIPNDLQDLIPEVIWDRLDTVTLRRALDVLSVVEEPAEFYRNVIRRAGSQKGQQASEVTTPDVLAEFMLAIAPTGGRLVFDPAAGTGGLLLDALDRGLAQYADGYEIDESALRIARRLFLLADAPAHIALRDSFDVVGERGPTADLVLCDPPLGAWWRNDNPRARGWRYGEPQSSSADLGWVQISLDHLSPTGTALVVTTLGALHRLGRDAEIRSGLLRDDRVRGIVVLPARLRSNTAIPLAVWILGDAGTSPGTVLLVDGSEFDSSELGPEGRLASITKAGLSGKFDDLDPTIAVPRRVLDLLTPAVNLLPSKWTDIPGDEKAPEEWAELVNAAVESANQSLGRAAPHLRQVDVVPADIEKRWVSIAELRDSKAIEVIRGRYLESSSDAEGPLVLNPRVFTDGYDIDAHDQRVADPRRAESMRLMPGDVIVYPTATSVNAHIWDRDGWAAGSHVDVIRIRDYDVVDPVFLSAALRHPRNRRHIIDSTLRAKMKIEDLTVLLPPVSDQRAFAELDWTAAQRTRELQEAILKVFAARQAVAEAATNGSVVVRSASVV